MKEILDTRFLLVHAFTDTSDMRDRARRKMEDVRRTREGVLPTVVISEFFSHVCRRAGKREAERHVTSLLAAGLRIEPLTPTIAVAAGGHRCAHWDVPLADCLIAATALELHGRVVSDDPHFRRIPGVQATWI